jgi:DNA-binding SARP family transcriptional activator
VEFRLLGPLEVVGDDGVPVALGGPRPRALLVRLPQQGARMTFEEAVDLARVAVGGGVA